MNLHQRIRDLAQTPVGRAQLTRFCGEDFSLDDHWQLPFEHAGDHATHRMVTWLNAHADDYDVRRAGESLASFQARKDAAYEAADAAMLAELERA